MDYFILAVLGLLAALAVIDLFVGVSNDAVNFLNSAVGSRAAPFWIIMTVASVAVLTGATFSSGMMEVAKTGVLRPEYFTFSEVIVVFTAVMVTDVLLLNTFNSLGLPTSTTVSIVFELLGGATAMACYKVWSTGAPFTDLGLYINSGKALAMIMAILTSVIVAFIAGLIVQYLLRILFTFHYERYYRYLGGLFAGVSLSAIFYFLVLKGLSGASFMTPEAIQWVNTHNDWLLWACFILVTVFTQIAILLFNLNIFPFIILAGTFALAFAFAGNDLVNFVGVPLAALESFNILSANPGVDPNTFTMEGLRAQTATPTMYLLASGIVMVLTLWFSKKAHRVIRTSISLASASRGGKEQFGSSLPARIVVRGAIRANNFLHQLIPAGVFTQLGKRFEAKKMGPDEQPLAFDAIRASVNLVLAAGLIASATSLKLPLSTTYVTFMVAMGSSLADGAWDRESAVYRISGVLTVISGWFVTAFTAFSVCAMFCALFIWLGKWFILLMMIVALSFVVKTNFFVKQSQEEITGKMLAKGDQQSVGQLLSSSIEPNLHRTLTILSDGLRAFLDEDEAALKSLKSEAGALYDDTAQARGDYYQMTLEGQHGTKADRDARNFYYRAFTSMKEVSYSLRDQIGVSENYIANCHSPFKGEMRENTLRLIHELEGLKKNFSSPECRRVLNFLENSQRNFMTRIGDEQVSLRKSELYLGYILFTREVINRYQMVTLLQRELSGGVTPEMRQRQEMEMSEPVQPSER